MPDGASALITGKHLVQIIKSVCEENGYGKWKNQVLPPKADFEKAEKLASEQQDNYVSIDSLLISSIQSDNNIEAIIKKVGLNLNKIQRNRSL